jgi:hypothetical protein
MARLRADLSASYQVAVTDNPNQSAGAVGHEH